MTRNCLGVLWGILLVAVPMYSQSGDSLQVLDPIRQYFQLTDTQTKAILAANDAYNVYSQQKQDRIQTVQTEIDTETAKDSLDAFQIGIRFAEIEAICRDLTARALALRKKNVDILTAAQKTKLAALEDVLKLALVIDSAQGANLLGDIFGTPTSFYGSPSNGSDGVSFRPAIFFAAFYSSTVYGCRY